MKLREFCVDVRKKTYMMDPNHVAILLREAWRQGKRIRRRTVANLPGMPPALDGGVVFPSPAAAVTIRRSRPHGHVAAVPGTLRSPGLVRVPGRKAGPRRGGGRRRDTRSGLEPGDRQGAGSGDRVDEPRIPARARPCHRQRDAGYARLAPGTPALDREEPGQQAPEGGNTLILYDMGSSYLEGRKCPLAAFGHNRDGKRGRMQVTYGPLCAADGCPVAVEVFAGNAGDPSTVAGQVDRVRKRFGIGRVALVGDRGCWPRRGSGRTPGPINIPYLCLLLDCVSRTETCKSAFHMLKFG